MTKLGVESHRAYYKPGEMIDLHARLSVYRNADEPLEDVYWTVMQPVLRPCTDLCGYVVKASGKSSTGEARAHSFCFGLMVASEFLHKMQSRRELSNSGAF